MRMCSQCGTIEDKYHPFMNGYRFELIQYSLNYQECKNGKHSEMVQLVWVSWHSKWLYCRELVQREWKTYPDHVDAIAASVSWVATFKSLVFGGTN